MQVFENGRIEVWATIDLNLDRIVDITDILLVITGYGRTWNSPEWGETAWIATRDINCDCIIDIADIAIVISEYGTSW